MIATLLLDLAQLIEVITNLSYDVLVFSIDRDSDFKSVPYLRILILFGRETHFSENLLELIIDVEALGVYKLTFLYSKYSKLSVLQIYRSEAYLIWAKVKAFVS